MATLFTALTAIGTQIAAAATGATASMGGIGSLIGTGLTAAGTIYGGIQAKAAADNQAAGLEQKSEQEIAIAQRKAAESRKEKRLVMSRQRALAAASGGGVNDPTVESIMADTERKGEYNALLDMYNGRTLRADLRQEARTVRAEGRSQMTGSLIQAGAGIYDGIRRDRRTTAEYSMI